MTSAATSAISFAYSQIRLIAANGYCLIRTRRGSGENIANQVARRKWQYRVLFFATHLIFYAISMLTIWLTARVMLHTAAV
ncbi:MAG: hypothetical protein KF726_05165 [Anaerolineae bacterium]|nr:hypothetical protein [Anaerolineae bacterium]